MTANRMHADEVDTDAALVGWLLAAQFPHWADLPIRPVPSAGTDNALYRLGEDLGARLPRIGWAVAAVAGLAPPGRHPRPARQGYARRGLSLAVVRLPLARR